MTALEGEVLAPARVENAAVLVNAHPFKRGSQRVVALPEGASIADAVLMSGLGPALRRRAYVTLAGHEIERKHWTRIRPKPGAELYIGVRLQGGGGGGKDVLRTVMMIAVVVVAGFFNPFAAGTLASSFFTVGVVVASQYLTNALIPPPQASRDPYRFDQQPGNPYASLTGIRNQFAPYAPIPRVMGQRRMYPVLAARPYTVMEGKTQWLHMALLVGYGPIDISDIRIGNTPITQFKGAEYEIREGWDDDTPLTLVTTQIREERLTVMLEANVWNVKATELATEEVSIDIAFPAGLGTTDPDDGKRKSTTVRFEVQWSVNGVSWTNADWIQPTSSNGTTEDGKITAKDTTTSATSRSGRFKVTGSVNGQYFVRVRRTTATAPSYVSDTAYWTSLRSVRAGNPINMTGLALIGLRLKATNQLNGVPDIINCLASAYHDVYDPDTETWTPTLTRNPAWECTDVLRKRGQQTICADSRLDLDAFVAWAQANDAAAPNANEKRWTCDVVLEGGSVMSAAQLIAASGRASFTIGTGGKYTVVRDAEQTVPVAHISPRNSWGYKGSKAFLDLPHALRCTYINPDANDQQDEVIVYRDDYNEDGTGGKTAATRFETLDFPTSRSATQTWREGRYHLGVLELRPEEHRVNQDIESIACMKGSFVRFSYDIISVGLGSGRVAELVLDGLGTSITALVLDIEVEMPDIGASYAVRVRHVASGSNVQQSTLYAVDYDAGPSDTLTLTTPIPIDADAPVVGDLVQFGESGIETAPMIVKHIRRFDNHNAQLTLVDAQPGVWTADTGAIPAFQSYINRQAPIADTERPSRPILNVRSDEVVMVRLADGTLNERVELRLDPYVSLTVPAITWEAEWKYADANGDDWESVGQATIDASLYINALATGAIVHLRARVISAASIPSLWEYVFDHVVVGKTTNPDPPSDLTVTATLDGVKVAFTASPSIDVAGYEIRTGGANWDAATVLDANVVTSPASYLFPLSGAVTFRIKARDVIGLYSTEVTAASPAANTAGPWVGVSRPPTVLDNLEDDGDFTDLARISNRPFSALSGRTANYLNYTGGGAPTVDSLQPQEAGANVTESRTAAAISGQGALATADSANYLTQVVARPDADLIIDDFGYSNETEFARRWSVVSGSGERTFANADVAVPGGRYLEVGNNSGNDQNWTSWAADPIPFDPSALYELTFIVRRTAGTGLAYLGLEGLAADKTTRVNTAGGNYATNQHYVCAAGVALSSSWTEYRGYIRGRSGTPSAGSAKPDPSAPGTMHSNVVYIRPMFLLNYNSAAGTSAIAFVRLRKVELARLGSSVTREDGSTALTDALAVTSLGTAAAISGQGALATRSTVNASYVDAASLTSDLMAAGGALNAADNGNFALGQTGWDTAAGDVTTDAPNAYVGDKYFLTSSGDGSQQTANKNVLAVTPGEYLRIAAVGKRHTAGTGGDCRVRLRYVDKDGAYVATTELNYSSETTYTLKASVSTVPANAVRCQITILKNAITGGRRYAIGAVWVDRVTVSGTHLVNSSGVIIGDSDIITASGTAAAITGQGSLATLSAVQATHVDLGDTSNMVPDPDFKQAAAWSVGSGWTFASTDTEVTSAMGAARGVKTVAGNGTTSQGTSETGLANTSKYVVEPGKAYRLSFRTLRKAGFTGRLRGYFRWGTRDGTLISSTTVSGTDCRSVAAASDTVEDLQMLATAPSNAYYMVIRFYVEWSTTLNNAGHGYFANPRVHRAAQLGTMVVREDGATALTDAAAVTSLGVAASISGQSALATLTPPSYAGNAAALSAGAAVGSAYIDTSDSNKLKTVVAASSSSGGVKSDTSSAIYTSGTTRVELCRCEFASVAAGGFWQVNQFADGSVLNLSSLHVWNGTWQLREVAAGAAADTGTLLASGAAVADDGTEDGSGIPSISMSLAQLISMFAVQTAGARDLVLSVYRSSGANDIQNTSNFTATLRAQYIPPYA